MSPYIMLRVVETVLRPWIALLWKFHRFEVLAWEDGDEGRAEKSTS